MNSVDIRRTAHLGRCLGALATLLLAPADGEAAGGTDPAALARELVAAQVGVPAAEVRILAVTARAFPDGSLECPVTGMAYAQVITPGHQVAADAAGRRFDVRVAGSSGRICHGRTAAGKRPGDAVNPDRPATMVPPADPAVGRARSDLANLLGVPPDTVTVLATHPQGPKEALPGCAASPPEDGDRVLVLGADGCQYTWLLRGGLAMPCLPVAARSQTVSRQTPSRRRDAGDGPCASGGR